jgi:hypothetical protein
MAKGIPTGVADIALSKVAESETANKIWDDLGKPIDKIFSYIYTETKKGITNFFRNFDPGEALKISQEMARDEANQAIKLKQALKKYQDSTANSKDRQSAINIITSMVDDPRVKKGVDSKTGETIINPDIVNQTIAKNLQDRKAILQQALEKARNDLASINKNFSFVEKEYQTAIKNRDISVDLLNRLTLENHDQIYREAKQSGLDVNRYNLRGDLYSLESVSTDIIEKYEEIVKDKAALNSFINGGAKKLINMDILATPPITTPTVPAKRPPAQPTPSVATVSSNQENPSKQKTEGTPSDDDAKKEKQDCCKTIETLSGTLEQLRKTLETLTTKLSSEIVTAANNAEIKPKDVTGDAMSQPPAMENVDGKATHVADGPVTGVTSSGQTQAAISQQSQGQGNDDGKNSGNNTGDTQKTLWDNIKESWIKGLGEGLKGGDFLSSFTKLGKDTVDKTKGMINTALKDLEDDQLKSLGDYLQSFRDSMITPVIDALSNILTTWLFKIFKINVPVTVPAGQADGGPVTGGTPYIVGEVGPELFVPSTSGIIVPNYQLSGSNSQGSAPPVTVNVINNSGQQVSARQESRFDGQSYVIDVWLDALNRNVGGLRDVVLAGR